MPHRVYPDLAALRAALGGPAELRVLDDQGDDTLLQAAFGQLADLGGGYLLLLTHALYDPDGVWARVQAAAREEPGALRALAPVWVAGRLGTLVQVGAASALQELRTDRRPLPGLSLDRLDAGDVERLLLACDPGDERPWPPLGSQRAPVLVRLGLGARWRGVPVATVAGAVLACRHRAPPLPGMWVRDRRKGRTREVYGPIPRLLQELRDDAAEPGGAVSRALSMIVAWAMAVRAWDGDAGRQPVALSEAEGLLVRIPQETACNILNREPGATLRGLLARSGVLPGAGDRAALQDWLARAALPALVFEDRGTEIQVRWPVRTTAQRATRGPARPDALDRAAGKARILELLDQARRPLAASTLAAKVPVPAPTVRRWIAELVDEGALERTAASPRDPRQSYRRTDR